MVQTGANPELKMLMEEIKNAGGKRVSAQIGAAVAKLNGQTGSSAGQAARKGQYTTVRNMSNRQNRQNQN